MAKLIYPMTEKDFYTMSQCSIHSGDIDPIYPILEQWFSINSLTKEERLWCCLLYLYCYNLPWTLQFFLEYPSLKEAFNKEIWTNKELGLVKLGADRRGIYWSGGLALALEKLVKFLFPYQTLCDYFDKYIEAENSHLDEDASEFIAVNKAIRDLPNGGVWSAFKYSDLITQTIDEVDLWCIDLFVRERLAGPGEAILALLGQDVKNHQWIKNNYNQVEENLNRWELEIGVLVKDKVHWNKDFKVTWFEIETVLCNYHSICVGSYYLGMDLDDISLKLSDKINKRKLTSSTDRDIYDIRQRLFDKANLLEFSMRQPRIDIKKYNIQCYSCKQKAKTNILL